MNILSIILFFIYAYGLGYSVTSWFENSKDFWERTLMRVGLGIPTFIVLSALLGIFRIPLDWKIFLIASLIIPLYGTYKNIKEKSFPQFKKKSTKYVLFVLILFCFSLYMYTTGAFSYSYFENDDPWEHAKSVEYLAREKTVFEPGYAEDDLFLYLDPRPPAYDSIMAMLYQVTGDMIWTLKFFNALFISLSLFFFFYFARNFTGKYNKAFVATVILFMIPAYLSHFIWSHTLIPLLMFVSLYCFEQLLKNKKWICPTIISVAGILLTQETQSVKFALLLGAYVIVKCVAARKILYNLILAPAGGFALAMVLWWIPQLVRFGSFKALLSGFYGVNTLSAAHATLHPSITRTYWGILGSGTRQHGLYTFSDFFFATSQNMINNPIGIGFIASLLLLLGLGVVYLRRKSLLKEHAYLLITLCWLVITFFGIHGGTHWWSPVALFSFRFWMLFSIPAALLAAEGIFLLKGFIPSSIKHARLALVLVLLLGIVWTSGMAKYELNTTPWGPGGSWASGEELQLFLWLKNLPPESRVLTYSERGDKFAMSFGTFTCLWCKDEIEFRKSYLHEGPDFTYQFMKKHNYKYLIFDAKSHIFLKKKIEAQGLDVGTFLNDKLQEIGNSGLFKPVYQNQGGVVFEVV
jgi:hypothetical protein